MSKRPLGAIGAVFFITVIILSKFGYEKSLYILPLCAVAVFLVFLKNHLLRFFVLFLTSVICAVAVFWFVDISFRTKEEYFSGENISVEGVICETPYYQLGDNDYVIIKTSKINGEKVKIKIRLSNVSFLTSDKLYSKVSLKANLYSVDSMDELGSSYFRSKNIPLIGAALSDTIQFEETDKKPLMYHIVSYRHKLFNTVAQLLPNDIGGFIVGVTIGEKDLMSENLNENFRITGTSHILVVSGMHVAVWSGFLYVLFRKIFSNKISALISIAFILFFMAFTGFTASVIRSGIMMILSYIAVLLSEKTDSLNSLGISALLLTAIDPFSIYNVGTVFSFASVFGILLMNEHVMPKIRFLGSKIRPKIFKNIFISAISLILVSFSAQLFTFPVSVLYNIKFSFLSIVSNFLISFLCDVVMVLGGIGILLLTYFPNFIISKALFGVSIVSSKIVIAIVDKLASYKNLYQNVTNLENHIFILLVITVLFLLVFLNISKREKLVMFSCLLLPLFLISTVSASYYMNNNIKFAVHNTGNGMCVTFSHFDETVMLACGGDSAGGVADYLKFYGSERIKALYLPVNNSVKLIDKMHEIKSETEIEAVISSAEYDFSYFCNNSTSADYVAAEYWGGKLRIDYFTLKKCSFAIASIGQERIIISFWGEIKKEFLPQNCQMPDVYVTMYKNTFKADFSNSEMYVVSNSFEAAVPISAKRVHTTYNNSRYEKTIKV